MCSILGLVNFEKKCKDKSSNIFKINKYLKHRGPDESGFYDDENVALAFNRLSIIDLDNGHQPVHFDEIITIFNGEIYNFREIKKQLIDKNFIFKTDSDSEIIPAAFRCWGINFISKLNGMFAISIYDKKNEKVYLIRDRVGIKPLFYCKQDNNLLFSSEIKGIINYPGFKKEINFSAIKSYLAFRYPTNGKNIFFKNISRVDPGTYIEIDIKKKIIKENTYWKIPNIEETNKFDEKYFLEELDNLLNKAVERNMVSDVPVGVLLSGGLDSSLLASIATTKSNQRLQTYSVSFGEREYDESIKAKNVSNFINSKHLTVRVNKDNFFENLLEIIKVRDNPISIPHEYPLYLLSKEIQKHIKVVLSGEGADEFWGGYSRVQKCPFDFKKGAFIHKHFNKNLIKKFFDVDKNFNFENSNYSDFFFHRYNWFKFNEIENLLSDNLKEEIINSEVVKPWKIIFDQNTNKDLYNTTLLLFQKYHLQCLLERLDSNTMANSVEARVPFLDHELIEFINKVPFKYKIKWKSIFHKYLSLFSNSEKFSEKNDINKYLLRKIAKKYLPNKTTNEKKLGFPLPMNLWMRDDRVKEVLLDQKTIKRGFFNKGSIENLFKSKIEGDLYDFSGKKIWMILNIELWAREHFD